jgi:hypothetical protein
MKGINEAEHISQTLTRTNDLREKEAFRDSFFLEWLRNLRRLALIFIRYRFQD